jgi:hypothetical protein
VRLPLQPVRVTYIVLVLIGLTFAAQFFFETFRGTDPIIDFGAKENFSIAHGELWRLFTAIFIHGSVLHVLFNVYALYNLGREVETFYGTLRFSLLFLIAGLSGSVTSLLLNPHPAIGASGAIFGLIGAEGVFLYRNRRLLGERGRRGQNVIFIPSSTRHRLAGRIDNGRTSAVCWADWRSAGSSGRCGRSGSIQPLRRRRPSPINNPSQARAGWPSTSPPERSPPSPESPSRSSVDPGLSIAYNQCRGAGRGQAPPRRICSWQSDACEAERRVSQWTSDLRPLRGSGIPGMPPHSPGQWMATSMRPKPGCARPPERSWA